jgi:hypothetical protein
MRAVRIIIAALLSLLSSSAWAQFGGPPPVSSYTVNVVVETPKGEVLYTGDVKCKTLERCDGPQKQMTVAGIARIFWVTFRWDGAQLGYELNFLHASLIEKKQTYLYQNRPSGKVVLKNKETDEKLLYDTPNGVAYGRMPEYQKGPIAKARVEVRT